MIPRLLAPMFALGWIPASYDCVGKRPVLLELGYSSSFHASLLLYPVLGPDAEAEVRWALYKFIHGNTGFRS